MLKLLDLRPFDAMPGLEHRYLFVGPSVRPNADPHAQMRIRVEQGRGARNVTVDAPRELIANLLWFSEMRAPSMAEHLRVPS